MYKTNILLIGGSSLLGRYLRLTKPDECNLVSTWYQNQLQNQYQLNITDQSQVNRAIRELNPHVIINCAAIGSVDYAQSHADEVHNVNVNGLRNIILATNENNNIKIVHLSSNAVYKGDNPPYNENSPQFPVNIYGRIKRESEAVLTEMHKNYLIIRPFLMYGWPEKLSRPNWATVIIDRLKEGKNTKLVNDVIWQPTYAYDVALCIWKLIEQDYRGDYNISASHSMTLFQFGLLVAEVFGLGDKVNLLEPVESAYFKDIAQRPLDTTYSTRKMTSIVGHMLLRNAVKGLKAMKDER